MILKDTYTGPGIVPLFVSSDTKSKCAPNFFHSNAHPGNEVVAAHVFAIIYSLLSFTFSSRGFCFSLACELRMFRHEVKMRFKSFHNKAHPGNEVVASGVFVIIYSSLSLAFPPVVFVSLACEF